MRLIEVGDIAALWMICAFFSLASFDLQKVKAGLFPGIPGFNINEATDILLKRDFDRYRGSLATRLRIG